MLRNGKVVLVVLALGALISLTLLLKRGADYDDPTRWVQPPLSATDPFGHDIFDSIMGESMPKGYRFASEQLSSFRPWQMHNQSLVIMAGYVDDDDAVKIDSLVSSGCKVMVVSDSFYDVDWPIRLSSHPVFDFDDFKDDLAARRTDTLVWCGENVPPATYPVPPQLVTSHILPLRQTEQSVAVRAGNEESVVVRVYGNAIGGELFVVGTPLIITNYGILDEQLSPFVVRVMSLVADRPVTRIEKRIGTMTLPAVGPDGDSSSVLGYFLAHPPTRAALYIVLALLVLFSVFRARRIQRVIPVVRPPSNHTLEFVQIVGNIYYNRGDYGNLLRMKYTYLAEELRRRLRIDIDNEDEYAKNCLLLARKTGLDHEFIQKTIGDARGQNVLEAKEVLDIIGRMNKILKEI